MMCYNPVLYKEDAEWLKEVELEQENVPGVSAQ